MDIMYIYIYIYIRYRCMCITIYKHACVCMSMSTCFEYVLWKDYLYDGKYMYLYMPVSIYNMHRCFL